MEPYERRGLQTHTCHETVLAEICPPRPCRYRQADLVAPCRQTHFTLAVKCEWPYVTFGQPVNADHVGTGLDHFLLAIWDRHLNDVGGVEQATNMLLGTENRRTPIVALVAAHPLEDGESIMKAVSEDVDVGLVVKDHRAVDPDSVGAQTVGSQDATSLWESRAPETAA